MYRYQFYKNNQIIVLFKLKNSILEEQCHIHLELVGKKKKEATEIETQAESFQQKGNSL